MNTTCKNFIDRDNQQVLTELTYPYKIFLFAAIGDGHICKRGYLNIHHSEDQLEYVNWKHSLFTKLGFECSAPKRKKNNTCNKYSYTFIVKGKEIGKKLRQAIYTPKKNYYNDLVFNNLTPLGLALWYMDDGCLRYIKDKDKNIRGNMIQIHTACEKFQAEYLIERLKKEGYLFKLFREYNLYSIYMSTRYSRKFLGLVEKYIRRVPSLYYKVDRLKPLTVRSSTTISDMRVGTSVPKQEASRTGRVI